MLQAYDSERGVYEDSTYWNPSWTLAAGAIMTSDITDVARSAIAVATTVEPDANPDTSYSTQLTAAIGKCLVPDQPPIALTASRRLQ